MAYLLGFHPGFISELEKAILYYSSESGKLAEKFKIATRKQLTGLKRNPHLRAVRYADVRFARIEKFPYAIHYSIDDTRKEVYIYALLSDYQNPDSYHRKRW